MAGENGEGVVRDGLAQRHWPLQDAGPRLGVEIQPHQSPFLHHVVVFMSIKKHAFVS